MEVEQPNHVVFNNVFNNAIHAIHDNDRAIHAANANVNVDTSNDIRYLVLCGLLFLGMTAFLLIWILIGDQYMMYSLIEFIIMSYSIIVIITTLNTKKYSSGNALLKFTFFLSYI